MDLSLEQLATYRDRNRVLLVFAPSADDAKYLEQKGWLKAQRAGLEERDLMAFYFLAGEAVPMREQYGVASNSFTVVLVGKDGGEKERYSEPIRPEMLFGTIDQMPMRRREMAEQEGS